MSADTRWRLLLGLGAIPSFFVVVCSIIETRAAKRHSMADDITASHALLNPTHGDQFVHHADGGIGSSSHGSSQSSTQAPFHDSFGSGGSNAPTGTSTGLLGDRKVERSDHPEVEEKRKFYEYLKHPDTWIKLMVTGGGWFIYDVAYCTLYSLSTVLKLLTVKFAYSHYPTLYLHSYIYIYFFINLFIFVFY